MAHKMKPVESTYEIILGKHLNQDVDEKWSTWAVDMMMIGYDTEHLVELAGIEKPYNQFELKELTDKVFEELNLDFTNRDKVVVDYVTYLATEVLNDNRDLLKTLREIKDLCIALDYHRKIYDFYSLYYAKEDLNDDTVQWYWNGADRTNIDQICMEYLTNWIKENGSQL
ncbi:hypothetical protein [Neptunitalea lumnitzerae]|uniref:Uncharacterized protein n=1 Tax=Neptunitalea lumnitzerae TaxID=2965509 RepID=A0ABQ5MH70_9FLAO|nr:hypothetical protein [Neptunitalea sp. Y10]GLB48737.1 hypothetical protein Y10_11050 [Neptunitalea sp. Y10]